MRRRKESVQPPANPDPETFLPLPHLPFQVLLALAEGSRHGWGVIERIRELSRGRDNPSSGSLYLAMARLKERGLIAEAAPPEESAGGRRRYFRLTPLGRRVLVAETERLAELVEVARRSSGTGDPG